ncbi:MAG: pyruvate dehydrogenase complex dihydrolipoamide acetyltransferase [Sphingomonadaceae bacterium]|nr:pyruvate dehydrogenase complex dihydrolipoamide acetyltransferase [Sphingomonadaceae bacterium]
MPIELKMPALSPTMEEGTLARWLVKEGDKVSSGDLLAEIETDKATMEFEAVDEGIVTQILVAEGTDGVKVGAVIAMIQGEDDANTGAADALPQPLPPAGGEQVVSTPQPVKTASITPLPQVAGEGPATSHSNDRIKASPLAKRIAGNKGLDLTTISGTGPNGRIVKADVEAISGEGRSAAVAQVLDSGLRRETPAPTQAIDSDIPHEVIKLSNMRKTIARRLTESKQTVPHIYLTVDVRLDALLKLRGELNASLEGRGIKLSVNDMLIKALALALVQVPKCNVSFAGDNMLQYARADISVAVSVPTGLITPIITDAANKSLSKISTEVAELAARAKDGKLQPHEYQGGTASISNMGMMGIKQFDAVINPPQAMILAVGAGEKRPYVVDDALAIATVMSATGSFDHRAIDGADGAMFMKVFKELVENPLGLVA